MVEPSSIGRAYQAHKRIAVVLFRLAPAAIVGGLRAPLLAHAGIILNHVIALRAPLLAHSSIVIQHCLWRRLALRERVLGPPVSKVVDDVKVWTIGKQTIAELVSRAGEGMIGSTP